MTKSLRYAIFIIFIAAPTFAEEEECSDCWWEPVPLHHEEDAQDWYGYPSVRRHHYAVTIGLPASYLKLKNPLVVDKKNIQAGRRHYEQECASCHGLAGYGDGEFARELTPRPANLAQLANISIMASDAYMYWTIAEGGTPIESSMPAYKPKLSDEQIWAVILYLRHDLSH